MQIRSHAQKYFQKVQKTGSTEPIPPPRPKRKPSDPPTADGRARTSDRSGSSGKQQAGAGVDSGGEENGSNRAISSPAGLDATAEGAAHVSRLQRVVKHHLCNTWHLPEYRARAQYAPGVCLCICIARGHLSVSLCLLIGIWCVNPTP